MLNTKYRPKILSEFFGQDKIVKELNDQFWKKNATSIIFHSSIPGVGKTTLARIVANMHANKHDIIEVDAGQNNSVESIKELIDSLKYSSLEGLRVIIIDESHLITPAAGAALLKIVEEPPKGHLFIFCTTNINKMLPTLVSRSFVYELQPYTVDETVKFLKLIPEISTKYNDEDLKKIASLANGSLRTAMNIAASNSFDKLDVDFISILNNMLTNKRSYVLSIIDLFSSIDFFKDSITQLDIKIKDAFQKKEQVYDLAIKIQKILVNNFIIANQLPKQFVRQYINLTILEIFEVLNVE